MAELNRRFFLRGIGGTALVLPYLDAMAANTAVGATVDSVPMRMACIGNTFGFMPERFFPKETGKVYKLPKMLSSLQPHQKNMTIFSDLDHGAQGQGGHRGVHAFLSGILSKNSKGYKEQNITVDQKAARSVGAQTRFQSMQFSASDDANNLLSWTNAGVAIPPMSDLNAIFKVLFRKTDKKTKAKDDAALESKTSIIDLVKEDAKLLMKQVGADDKQKLDRYFSSIRSVEAQLKQSREWVHQPKPTVNYKLPKNADSLSFAERLPLYYDLMALALQTDSTRVITFGMADIGGGGGGLGITRGYHQLSHHGKVVAYMDELEIIESFMIKQFSRFLDQLKAVNEPNGKTLFDNTITLFGSGMGNASSHSNKSLPMLLAGGGFRHGSHVSYAENKTSNPASNLLVSMLQKFGLEVDQFGCSTGTLSRLELNS